MAFSFCAANRAVMARYVCLGKTPKDATREECRTPVSLDSLRLTERERASIATLPVFEIGAQGNLLRPGYGAVQEGEVRTYLVDTDGVRRDVLGDRAHAFAPLAPWFQDLARAAACASMQVGTRDATSILPLSPHSCRRVLALGGLTTLTLADAVASNTICGAIIAKVDALADHLGLPRVARGTQSPWQDGTQMRTGLHVQMSCSPSAEQRAAWAGSAVPKTALGFHPDSVAMGRISGIGSASAPAPVYFRVTVYSEGIRPLVGHPLAGVLAYLVLRPDAPLLFSDSMCGVFPFGKVLFKGLMTLAYAEHAVGVPDATGIRAAPMIDLPFPDGGTPDEFFDNLPGLLATFNPGTPLGYEMPGRDAWVASRAFAPGAAAAIAIGATLEIDDLLKLSVAERIEAIDHCPNLLRRLSGAKIARLGVETIVDIAEKRPWYLQGAPRALEVLDGAALIHVAYVAPSAFQHAPAQLDRLARLSERAFLYVAEHAGSGFRGAPAQGAVVVAALSTGRWSSAKAPLQDNTGA